MRKLTVIILFTGVLAAMVLQSPVAQAQRLTSNSYSPKSGSARPLEFSVNYGSMWGGNIDTIFGKLRIATGDSWYFAANVPIRHGMWGEFSYTRQGTRINLENLGVARNLTDMTVHYWQIGALQGLPRGNFVPFFIGTLGLTYYSPEASTVEIEDLTYGLNSATNFSMTFGVGFKADMGPDQRVGLRGQFRIMPTIYNASGGLWFGTGGGGVAVSGSAVWQYEVSGGVVIKLGR